MREQQYEKVDLAHNPKLQFIISGSPSGKKWKQLEAYISTQETAAMN